MCGLMVLLMALMILFPGEVKGARDTGMVGVSFFLPLAAFFAVTIVAVQRKARWARGAATVAAVLFGLTICGLPVAIPVIWGLWKAKLQNRSGAS
jgi:threonine/homoserine efflux transporter RhtA